MANRTVCRNNLKQIGLALHTYHSSNGCFPSGYLFTPPATLTNGQGGNNLLPAYDWIPPQPGALPNSPGWGWAALLLPYLEQNPLSKRIDLTLPVEGPTSLAVRTVTLKTYTCPSDSSTGVFMVKTNTNQDLTQAATNSYAACFGALGFLDTRPDLGNGAFYRNSQVRVDDVNDGTSSTLAVGERCAELTQTPWAGVMTPGTAQTTPGAPVYTARFDMAPSMALAHAGSKALNNPFCEPNDFFSPHRNVVQFVFLDGSVHSLTSDMGVDLLQALATISGGEAVGIGDF
jgi:hypothetical protein